MDFSEIGLGVDLTLGIWSLPETRRHLNVFLSLFFAAILINDCGLEATTFKNLKSLWIFALQKPFVVPYTAALLFYIGKVSHLRSIKL